MSKEIDVDAAIKTAKKQSTADGEFFALIVNQALHHLALVEALKEIADVYEEFENGEPVACQLDAACKAARELLPTPRAEEE